MFTDVLPYTNKSQHPLSAHPLLAWRNRCVGVSGLFCRTWWEAGSGALTLPTPPARGAWLPSLFVFFCGSFPCRMESGIQERCYRRHPGHCCHAAMRLLGLGLPAAPPPRASRSAFAAGSPCSLSPPGRRALYSMASPGPGRRLPACCPARSTLQTIIYCHSLKVKFYLLRFSHFSNQRVYIFNKTASQRYIQLVPRPR